MSRGPFPEPDLPLDAAKLDELSSRRLAWVLSKDVRALIANARAALTLRDELAALVGELAECRAKLAQAEQEHADCALYERGAKGRIATLVPHEEGGL